MKSVVLTGLVVASSAIAQGDHSRHMTIDPHAAHRQPKPVQSAAHDEHAAHRPSGAQTESERAHVPPDPPSLVLGEMSNERMIELMQMEDDAALGMIRLDELEAFRIDDETGLGWDVQSWYGTDYDKLWLKVEGERMADETQARAELLWDRIVSPWWSVQAGVRHDFLQGPARTWAAVGVQGTAPQFVEVEATIYVGEQGRTAARISAEHDLLITQRLVLQSQVEIAAYAMDDHANDLGAGLADLEIGLRLRYEIIREVAPYVGVRWVRELGKTADLARVAGRDDSELFAVAGLRAWF